MTMTQGMKYEKHVFNTNALVIRQISMKKKKSSNFNLQSNSAMGGQIEQNII